MLKLFFDSLYANTGQPFDMMVFDNGSCEEVQDYLLDLKHNGKIQYLIFSQQNLKKLGALNFLLSAAPGEYIAYADSDVYFLQGWLDESLKVLAAFPEVKSYCFTDGWWRRLTNCICNAQRSKKRSNYQYSDWHSGT